MPRRLLSASLVASLLLVDIASAQVTGRLSGLISGLYGPDGLIVDSLALLPSGETHSAHFNSDFQSEFTQFNVALASQVATVPLPSPASGFTYEYDAEAGVFVRSTQSFGPILAERAETIGKNKFAFGFNFQRFTFDTIEGLELTDLRAVFTHDGAEPGGKADVVTTHNSIDTALDQFTFFGTIGLTERFDFSVAIPMVSVEMKVVSEATVQRIGTTDPRVHFFGGTAGEFGSQKTFTAAGDASGIGDVHLQLKGRVYKQDSMAIAAGLDLRLPSGDEEDLLGAGSMGVRPFGAISASHRLVSSHINFGYLWNGDSLLAAVNEDGSKGSLPDQFEYVAGVDVAVHEQVTVTLDLLGRVVRDVPRASETTFTALDGHTTFRDIGFSQGTASQTNLATGFKVNLFGSLLFDANLLISLDDAGLRDEFTPLFGIEYSF